MKVVFQILLSAILCTACFFTGTQATPKIWDDNKEDLIEIVNRVSSNSKNYEEGANKIPEDLDFSYCEHFIVSGDLKDRNNITITFYTNSGLVDHYSAIIYTTQKGLIEQLEYNVKNGGNDFKLKNNWYAIND
ncbi:hypothetical protein ACQWU4_07375 [Chryseobacterium sp. MIQD13]|uniref:hypothetical protein n=1 Tax=Chryseobacterium sp. MIQD13 TaxID=3422310 RepID=UPI003D2CF7F7